MKNIVTVANSDRKFELELRHVIHLVAMVNEDETALLEFDLESHISEYAQAERRRLVASLNSTYAVACREIAELNSLCKREYDFYVVSRRYDIGVSLTQINTEECKLMLADFLANLTQNVLALKEA